jgi:hypothetical protein
MKPPNEKVINFFETKPFETKLDESRYFIRRPSQEQLREQAKVIVIALIFTILMLLVITIFDLPVHPKYQPIINFLKQMYRHRPHH